MEGVVSNFAGAWAVDPYKGMCLEMAGNFDYMFVVAPVVGCNQIPCLYFDYHPFLFVSFALESWPRSFVLLLFHGFRPRPCPPLLLDPWVLSLKLF